jgi:hypothetical protein
VRKRLMTAARALHDRIAPAPGQNPASFCVRSASVILPPGADWVEPAKKLVLVRPDQKLTLA